MSITQRHIDQAYSDSSSTYGAVKEDYFALLYLEFDLVVRQNPISREQYCG